MEAKRIEISSRIVFEIVLIIAVLWLLYIVRDVLALLFISVIIVSAIEPAVNGLQKKKIPRSVSVLGIYVLLLVVLVGAFSFLIPPLVNQFQDFSQNFPVYMEKFQRSFGPVKNFIQTSHLLSTEQIFKNIGDSLSNLSMNVFSTTVGVFSGFISIIVVFSLTFYMSVKEDAIKHFIVFITPEKYKSYAASLSDRIKDKIGKWMLGQIFLMMIIGLFDFIGLSLVGVPYALVLSIFAGLMEIVPYMGPIISAIPGIFLGFLVSPTTGFLALIVYIVVQQLENHVVTPQVMKRAVGLNPIVVILALMVGVKLGGTFGAILSIPVATAVGIFVGDLMRVSKNRIDES